MSRIPMFVAIPFAVFMAWLFGAAIAPSASETEQDKDVLRPKLEWHTPAPRKEVEATSLTPVLNVSWKLW